MTSAFSASFGLQRGLGIAAEDRAEACASCSRAMRLQRGLGIAAEDRR